MNLLSFKQAFRSTCSKVNNSISSTLSLLPWLVTIFATGAIASLFITQLITTFGAYSCIVGGSASILAFLLIRNVLGFIKCQFNALFIKKTLTQKELDELELQESIALKCIKEKEKKELAEINKKIKKDIPDLEKSIFEESVSSNPIKKIFSSNKWNERDRRVISAYREMQRAYRELEPLALKKTYTNIRISIEQEFAKIRENAEKEGVKIIQSRVKNLINQAAIYKEECLNDLQLEFKKRASNNYPLLKDQILCKDLYDEHSDKNTKINLAMVFRMLNSGFCPLVSDCDEYKIFWHNVAEFNQEYQKYQEKSGYLFRQIAAPTLNQNNPKPSSVLHKVRKFFSKHNTESVVPCTNISMPFYTSPHAPIQQNLQAPYPHSTIQTTDGVVPLTLNDSSNNQKIITPHAV